MNPSFSRFTLFGAVLAATALACSQPTDDAADTSANSIVGGVEAQVDAWPGTVALYKGGSRPSCGGSLIHASWVVTAAHCVSTTTATGGVTKVVIGRHDLTSTAGETRTVDKAVRHAAYGSYDNDIAILHLSEPSTLPTVKLPTSAQLASVVTGGDTTVVGWGNTKEGGGSSNVLREVTVPIIANDQCKAYSGYSRVTANMICAGLSGGTKDSCQGDSGGPLFMLIDGEQLEIGLVSWGIGCARANAPGVYTRVGNYLNWLYEKTEGAVGEAPAPAPEPTPNAE